MNEILVLNLTRFGDLIQTTPLLRRLKAAHPQARITLAAQHRFRAVLPLMTGYDRCLLFDQDRVARGLAGRQAPLEGYLCLDEFVRELEKERYDLVINLTANRLSAYLVSLLSAGQVAGITSTDSGQRFIDNPWAVYLYSFLLGGSRRLNRINLVDIFCKMAGVEPDGMPVFLQGSEQGENFAARFLRASAGGGEKIVGIQLGASEGDRCWPVESFARLSDRLQESCGVRTLLFGSPAERPLAERAKSMMRLEPLDAVGATSIEELFSLLRKCALLVTNDTGTMHFAAAAATPVVMLTIGPASFHCTGPYSAGNLALRPLIPCSPCHYNLTCSNPVCRERLTVGAVHAACRSLLGERTDFSAAAVDTEICRSSFAADGFLQWTDISGRNQADEELAQRYLRLWKGFLGPALTGSTNPSPPLLFPELVELAARGEEIAAGIKAAAAELPLPLDRIASLGDREAAVAAQIKLLGSRTPAMEPLVDYLTLLRDNFTAEGLLPVARETARHYELAHRLAASL